MKHTDTELKKGDQVWVQTYSTSGSPFRLRMAEVITVMQIPVGAELKHHVAVHYLDEGNINYECVPWERIRKLYDKGNTNY